MDNSFNSTSYCTKGKNPKLCVFDVSKQHGATVLTSQRIISKFDKYLYGFFFISDTMRAYFQQIRQETGVRVVEKVFDPATDKPSKVSKDV